MNTPVRSDNGVVLCPEQEVSLMRGSHHPENEIGVE